jgi:hypothetical protein
MRVLVQRLQGKPDDNSAAEQINGQPTTAASELFQNNDRSHA